MGFLFPDFCFWYFIVGVQKCLWFLNIDFVSWCFAKFTLKVEKIFGGVYRVFYAHYYFILQKMTVLLPPFQFGCVLFLFLLWSLWLGLPILCWIGVVKSRYPCLVPDLSGKALSFCLLSMMLAVGLSYMSFIMLRNAPSIPTLLSVFIINGCCHLSNVFFCIYVIWSRDFCLSSCLCEVVYLLICKYCTILASLGESHLIRVYNLFTVLLDVVCQYFVEDFSVYVHQQYWLEVFSLCYVFPWSWD